MAARNIVCADPSLNYTSVWKGTLSNKLTQKNKQNNNNNNNNKNKTKQTNNKKKQLSEQIRPWDTQAYGRDVKQTTNKPHLSPSHRSAGFQSSPTLSL